jgi:hypothetical protein
MKVQEVILRAMSGKIKWFQAAQILGISARQMRRWRRRCERHGYDGLFDRRRQIPSPRRIPFATAQEVLRLYPTTPRWPWLARSILATDCVLHTVYALSSIRP